MCLIDRIHNLNNNVQHFSPDDVLLQCMGGGDLNNKYIILMSLDVQINL